MGEIGAETKTALAGIHNGCCLYLLERCTKIVGKIFGGGVEKEPIIALTYPNMGVTVVVEFVAPSPDDKLLFGGRKDTPHRTVTGNSPKGIAEILNAFPSNRHNEKFSSLYGHSPFVTKPDFIKSLCYWFTIMVVTIGKYVHITSPAVLE